MLNLSINPLAHRPIKALAGLSREVLPVRGFFKGTRMKKLLNAAGCEQATLAPKAIAAPS